MRVPNDRCIEQTPLVAHSHSMVAGGFELTS
jgi:hypothetical protein